MEELQTPSIDLEHTRKRSDKCRKESQATESMAKVVSGHTVSASKGRPLGALVCWLEYATFFVNKSDHVNMLTFEDRLKQHFTFEERVDARTKLKALPGVEALMSKERKCRSVANGDAFDEDEEPHATRSEAFYRLMERQFKDYGRAPCMKFRHCITVHWFVFLSCATEGCNRSCS